MCAVMSALVSVFAVESAYADCMDQGADVQEEEMLCTSEPGYLITPDMIPDHKGEGGSGFSLNSGEIKTIPLLVVVVGFNNMAYDTGYDWNEVFFDQYLQSIYQYYKEMSYDQVTFWKIPESSEYGLDGNTNTKDKVNDGVVHVKVDRDHQNWGKYSEEGGNGESMARAYREALIEAANYADLTKYDDNDDGKLSAEEFAVVFIVAGYDYGAAKDSKKQNDSLYLRSHRWSFSGIKKSLDIKDFSAPKVTKNKKSVTVNNYVCVAEKCEKSDGTVVRGRMGSIAHELGHHLGLPDLYDTTSGGSRPWEYYDVQHVSLMGSGSWGEDRNGNYRPYSLDPWSRIYLEWTSPVTISATGIYSLKSQDYIDLSKGKTIYRIDMPYEGEYYLVEARYAERWDSEIMKLHYPDNKTKGQMGGIIFWHVDETVLDENYNTEAKRHYDLNAAAHRPGVMPLFPEWVDNGSGGKKLGLIGTGASGKVLSKHPFFDYYLMQNTSSYKDIGQEIDLPTYAGKQTSSLPKDRESSGIRVELRSDASTSMAIRLISQDHVHSWKSFFADVTPEICAKGGSYRLVLECTKCKQQRVTSYYNNPGHHFSMQYVSALPPDCEYDGHKEYYKCNNCGKLYSDSNGTNEVTMADLVIPGGHEWDEGVVIEPPTYYSDGILEVTCKMCGTSYWDSVDRLDHSTKPGDDGNPCGPYAAIQVADEAIRKTGSNKDMPGAAFSELQLSSPKQGKKSITLKWKSVINELAEEADCYYIYGAECGKAKYQKIDTVYGTSATIEKIGSKALKPKKYYKFIVVAVLGGSEDAMTTSKTICVATAGSKSKANHTGVSVSKSVIKKAGKLKKGRKLSLKAKAIKKKGTKVVKYKGLRYESTNRKVATVSSKGVIKAKSAGMCRVYVYAQNGKCKAIDVKVK